MKKMFFTGVIFMALTLNIKAQVDHDYNPNDIEPGKGSKLTNDQVPASVLEAMKVDFALDKPQTWTKFPYALKEYGWVYDKGAASVQPDRYEVTMKTTDGVDLYAVYSKDGTLVTTKESFVNVPLPASVKEKLDNSKYKDWTIIGNQELIRYYYDKNSVDQHFRITVTKGDVIRTISFNYQAKAGEDLHKK
jgi:hypothetical protein